MISTGKVMTYLLEAAAIAFVNRYILGQSTLDQRVVLLMITVMVSHIILDLFAPEVGRAARQGTGFGLGSQMTGGGIQAARGLKRTLLGVGHMPGQSGYRADGQIGGGSGLQAALGMQRTLRGDQHGGMDDREAISYYSGEDSNVDAGNDGEYARLVATSAPVPAQQVNVIERFIDDKVALDYYRNDRSTGCAGSIHEKFISNILGQRVEDFVGGAGETVHETVRPSSNGPRGKKTGNVLYSNDLISIQTTKARKLVLLEDSKFLKAVPKGEEGLNDRLFKLRFKLQGKRTGLVPVKYGDGVAILFNDETAQTVPINHDGDLNILENNRDIIFELVSMDNPGDRGSVNMADKILIRRSVKGTVKRYLRVAESGRIVTDATVRNATPFSILPVRGCGPLWRYDTEDERLGAKASKKSD